MTDRQKSKLYEAEQLLRRMYDNSVKSDNPAISVGGANLVLPPEVKFGSVASVQAYVDRVLEMPSVIEVFGTSNPITVRKRKGETKAHYSRYNQEIAVHDGRNNWGMRELVILHELAHHFTPTFAQEAHGAEFADTFITLVGLVMGSQAGLALLIIFDTNDVRTNPKHKSAQSTKVSATHGNS